MADELRDDASRLPDVRREAVEAMARAREAERKGEAPWAAFRLWRLVVDEVGAEKVAEAREA